MPMSRVFNDMAQQPIVSSIPSDGVFVDGEGQAVDGLVTLYTVPFNYIMFIYNYYINVDFIAAGYGEIRTYSSVPVYKYRFDYMGGQAGDNNHNSQLLQPQLVLTAGESVRLFSSATNVIVDAGFFGYRWYIL